MIHIKRSNTPTCLVDDGLSDGCLETQRAIHHYTSGETEEFDFQVYKNVKEQLKVMFSGKCAYCESRIAHDQYMQVEHYRPKGHIEGQAAGTPGYYWLGSNWDNLLLSCEACNGKRHKGNHFPLVNPLRRAKNHLENISNEEPLLINPCDVEHPEDHLLFNEFGEIEGITKKGSESIKCYGLYRNDLREERARHINELNTHLISLAAIIEGYNINKSQKAENAIKDIIRLFNKKQDKESQFAGLSRQYLQNKLYDIINDIENNL